MGRRYTLVSRPFRLPSRRPKPAATTGKESGTGEDVRETVINGTGIERTFASFRMHTFFHVDAVYSNALCLTGSLEEAEELVVETYVRAFEQYEQFRRRHAPARPSERDTIAWLFGNMHAAFCQRVLARTDQTGTPAGDRS